MPTREWRQLSRLDWLSLICLGVFVCVGAAGLFKANAIPYEDAAILMRYSEHFAQGHGIVWNVGEKPVDGATDFLFMAALAGLVKIGLSLEKGVLIIGVLSHLLTVWTIFLAVRVAMKGNLGLALTASLSFAFGPGLHYVAMFFGTPFFALFAALSWFLAVIIAEAKRKPNKILLSSFAFSCLLTALTRPEGLFLAIFMAFALIYYRSWSAARPVVFWLVGFLAVFGGLYFWWHWHYFGYPLPNPFYKKGGGHLHPDSLKSSLFATLSFAGIFVVVFIAGILTPATRKRTIFSLIPIVLFAFLWVLMSNEMNHLNRFQYVLFPLLCISWPLILNSLWNMESTQQKLDTFHGVRSGLLLAAAIVACVHWGYQYVQHKDEAPIRTGQDANYDVASLLSSYSDAHYTLATTEAGLLPLYSGWRSIDMWGLNDAWIAHHGGLTEQYLHEQRPNVIIFHALYDPTHPLRFTFDGNHWSWWGLGKPWYSMVQSANHYAIENHYKLAACSVGSDESEAYYYYVRPGFKDSSTISNQIQHYFAEHR